MAVTIDIVAAVKEALQDPEVRDRIRTIVQEALPPPRDPVEGLEVLERALVHAADRLTGLTRIAIEEVVDQQRDVFPSLPQRRYLEGEHVQSIEQVLPELSTLDLRIQVAVGRGANR